MKKTKSMIIALSILLTSLVIMPSISAPGHPDYTTIEIIPNSYIENFTSPTLITLSIYVTPQNDTFIDTVSTDMIYFTPDTLQCEEITWGNLFESTTFQLKGNIDNNAGTITDMVWGSTIPTNESGYFVNMTFNITNPGSGSVIIDTDYAGVAYEASELPFRITHNFTLGTKTLFASNEYPVNRSTGLPVHLLLEIDIYNTLFEPMDLYFNSNVTGEWRMLDHLFDLNNGRYNTSTYGVIHSPYNQELQYLFGDKVNNTYTTNTCPGKYLGTISKVEIYTPSFSGTLQPIFMGIYDGDNYIVSGSTYTDITEDNQAPTIWTWKDVENIQLYTSLSTTAYIIVTYDLGFGEGERIDWSVNLTDNSQWVNESYWYMTKIVSPVISNPTPRDAGTWNYYYPTLSVDIYDPNGDTMNVSFYWLNETDEWEQIGTNQTGGNDTYSQELFFANNYSQIFYWKVVADDSENMVEKIYRFKIRDVQEPPYNFSTETVCEYQINLTWIKPEHTDYVRIQRRTDNYPSDINDGLNIYNGTDIYFYDTDVIPGTQYYYSSWSWNNTDKTWSVDNSTISEITAPTEVTNFVATTLSYDSINLTWIKGIGAASTIIRRKIDSYPTHQSDGDFVYEGEDSNFTDTGLGGNITYFYRAWAHYRGDIFNPAYSNEETPDSTCTAEINSFQSCYNSFEITPGRSLYCTEIQVKIGHNPPGGDRYHCRVYLQGEDVGGDGVNEIQIGYFSAMSSPSWKTCSVPNVYLKGGGTYTIRVQGAHTCSPRCAYGPTVVWENKLYRVWGTYGYYSCDYDEDFTTTDVGPPLVLTQETTNINDTVAKLNGKLIADGGEATTVGFIWENETGLQNITIGLLTNNEHFELNISDLFMATTYSFKTWAQNNYGYVEGDELFFNTKPYAPTNISIYNISYTGMSLSWDIGSGADMTYVIATDDPDCELCLMTELTEKNYTHFDDLLPNVTYYFRIWSYNATEDFYSNNYDEGNASTLVGAPLVTTLSATNIQNETATLRGTLTDGRGEDCTMGFRWGSSPGVYTYNITKGIYSTGNTITHDISSLSKGNTYYYRCWAENQVGWVAGDEISFSTRPVEPNGFTASRYGARQINLSWNNGQGADKVLVIAKDTGYPTSISDGTTLIFDENNSCTHTQLAENSTWYYRIWSYNDTNGLYSTDNVSTYTKTGYLPNITFMSPCSEINVARPPSLQFQAEGDYSHLTYSIYGFYGHAPKILGESTSAESGWSNPQNVLTYPSYANYYQYGTKSYYWSGYIYGSWLTISFDDAFERPSPEIITGINIDYSSITVVQVSFHNYDTDTWSTYSSGDRYTPCTKKYWELPSPTNVDAVRIRFGKWVSSHSSTYTISANLDYAEFVLEPELIHTDIVTSGTLDDCIWTNAITGSKYHSWFFEVYDGIDYLFNANDIPSADIDTIYNWCNFETEGVVISNPIPYDGQSNLMPVDARTCSAEINHTSGAIMDVAFFYYNGTDWIAGGQNNSVGNGTYQWIFPNCNENSETYHWKLSIWDGLYYHNKSYLFITRDVPQAPDFNLTNFNATVIHIADISGDEKTNSIMIRAKKGSYPVDREDGDFLFNGTLSEYDHIGLDPNTYYYYSAWSWNNTDNAWSNANNKNIQTLGPQPPSFNLSKYNKSIINITEITINDAYSDTILIRAKIGSYPTNRTDGIFVVNTSSSSFDHTGLQQATHYYYRAWAYDADTNWWSTSTDNSQKTNGPPTISNFYPEDNASIDGINPRLQVTVGEYNPEDVVTIYFRSNYSGGWTTINTQSSTIKTFYYQTSEFFYQDYQYWWSVNVTDGELWANNTLTFETGSMDVPEVTATTYNVSQINLSWIKANFTTHTWIQRKIDDYPVDRTDGVNVYFGTGEYFEDTGLEPGELYCYRIWSYNSTVSSYSGDTTTTLNLTKPYGPVDFTAVKIGYRSINLSWIQGDGAQGTLIRYKEDNYPTSITDGIQKYIGNDTWYLATDLKPDDFLNYYSPLPGTDNFGVYGGGDPFENSCDNNVSSKWDLKRAMTGNFSYELGLEPQRIKGFALLYQDFYEDPGTDWEAAITDFEVYNGSWHHDWNGMIVNTNTSPQWHYYESPTYYDDATEVRFNAWTEWITPNLYEVYVGKLGYVHCFRAWSYVTKGGITQYSDDYESAENKTDDTPPNNIPEISNMNPANESTGLEFNPLFNVTISDKDGNMMNISWQYLYNGSWTEFGQTISVGNGTYNKTSGIFTDFGETYYWRVVVVDDADIGDSSLQENTNISEIYWFTIRGMYIPDDPITFNANNYLWHQINLTWTFTSDAVYIERSLNESWLLGSGTFIYQGANNYFNDTTVLDDTTYYYQIWGYNITDSSYSLNYLSANATTDPSPNDPPYAPFDGYVTSPISSDETYLNVYDITMHCTVVDPDGDTMDVYFYWGNDTLIGVVYDVVNNTEAELFLPDHWTRNILGYDVSWVEHDTTYNWYAIAEDSEFTSSPSDTWSFHTCIAWDLNIDRTINYLDVSILVSNYLKSVTPPGASPWDINEQGITNYLDVSIMVSNYLKTY